MLGGSRGRINCRLGYRLLNSSSHLSNRLQDRCQRSSGGAREILYHIRRRRRHVLNRVGHLRNLRYTNSQLAQGRIHELLSHRGSSRCQSGRYGDASGRNSPAAQCQQQ